MDGSDNISQSNEQPDRESDARNKNRLPVMLSQVEEAKKESDGNMSVSSSVKNMKDKPYQSEETAKHKQAVYKCRTAKQRSRTSK